MSFLFLKKNSTTSLAWRNPRSQADSEGGNSGGGGGSSGGSSKICKLKHLQ